MQGVTTGDQLYTICHETRSERNGPRRATKRRDGIGWISDVRPKDKSCSIGSPIRVGRGIAPGAGSTCASATPVGIPEISCRLRAERLRRHKDNYRE